MSDRARAACEFLGPVSEEDKARTLFALDTALIFAANGITAATPTSSRRRAINGSSFV